MLNRIKLKDWITHFVFEWRVMKMPYDISLLGWAWLAWLAGLHCKTRVCMSVCLHTYIWLYTKNYKRKWRYTYISNLHMCYCSKCDWQRTPDCVTQRWSIYWVWETDCKKKGLLLDCSVNAKENRSEGDQSRTKIRQARLGLINDTYTVRSLSHSVDPLAWSQLVRSPSYTEH